MFLCNNLTVYYRVMIVYILGLCEDRQVLHLVYTWFTRASVPNCGRARPVVLVMDNHDAHISADLTHAARENEVVLVGLPSHTTHLLKPLNVHINGPLKQKVNSPLLC